MFSGDPRANARQQVCTDAHREVVRKLGLRTMQIQSFETGTQTYIAGDLDAAMFQMSEEGWVEEIAVMKREKIAFRPRSIPAKLQQWRMHIDVDSLPKYRALVFAGIIPHIPSLMPHGE